MDADSELRPARPVNLAEGHPVDFACETCGAAPGFPCTSGDTELGRRGTPRMPHPARVKRAAGYARRMAKRQKRGYSREFTPHGKTGKRYLIDDIPAGLWSAVRAKASREGLSLRAAILKLLTEWVKR